VGAYHTSLGTFIVLNQSGIFNIGDIDVPYPIYALLGMAFWQLFATGLVAGSNSLVSAGALITKINIS
jgi:lipopolysaccharide transport system permease protein